MLLHICHIIRTPTNLKETFTVTERYSIKADVLESYYNNLTTNTGVGKFSRELLAEGLIILARSKHKRKVQVTHPGC